MNIEIEFFTDFKGAQRGRFSDETEEFALDLSSELSLGEGLHLISELGNIPYAFFGNRMVLERTWSLSEILKSRLRCLRTDDLRIYSPYDPNIIMPDFLYTQTMDGTFREYYLGSFLAHLCGQWGLHLLCFLSESQCAETIFLPDQERDPEAWISILAREGINLEYQLKPDRLMISELA